MEKASLFIGRVSMICTFLPPHILEGMARSSRPELARRALETLALTERLRGGQRYRAAATAGRARSPEAREARAVFTARHRTALPGSLERSEGEPPVPDRAANEAYDATGATWTFYREAFERNSIDDAGTALVSSVHYAREYDNAFWDGAQMVYGDGDGEVFGPFTRCLDVIGHELTHGVVQAEGDLRYEGQPGALNESLADAFGSMVKQFDRKQTVAQADWLIGDGIFAEPAIGAAIRSMRAPGTAYDSPLLGGRDPQPAHMRDYYAGDDDDGGVHINSGIPNRAFYLAATALGGYAWEGAGRVWYDALVAGLRPTCTFAAFAHHTLTHAGERFGPAGAAHVRRAWETVGVL